MPPLVCICPGARPDVQHATRSHGFRGRYHAAQPANCARRLAKPSLVISSGSPSQDVVAIEHVICPRMSLQTESGSPYVRPSSKRFLVLAASAQVARCFAMVSAICRTRSRCHAWCCANEVADASSGSFGRLAGKNKVVGMPPSPSHKAQCVVANGVSIAVLQHIDSRVSSSARSIAS